MFTGRHSHRRHLPHYQHDFRSYFVTFVTRNRMVLPAHARDVVFRHVVECAQYFLHVAVVMPDHVHLVATPHDALGYILGRIKGASARETNLVMGRTGKLWQDESFDNEVRRDESLAEKCEYVRQNPVRKGLVDRPEDYPWLWERTW